MSHFKAKILSFSSDLFQIKILWFGGKFIALIVRMNSRDFRELFLYEWESKHSAAVAARNINAEFGNGSVNECTIRHWYAKFKTGNESHKQRPGQTRNYCRQWSFTSNSWK